jgi:CheY-like chemotaxis protein
MNARPRILVVDDDASLRLLFALVLQGAGYEPTAVASVDRALERLASEHYDVVLTDLVMPGRTGLELLAALKVVAPEVPAVAMTGSDEDVRRQARALGARDVLGKPLDADDLVASLAVVRERTLREAA